MRFGDLARVEAAATGRPLMSSSRRSSPARSWLRASRRADSSAVAAWSARIVSSRRSSGVELVEAELGQGDDADRACRRGASARRASIRRRRRCPAMVAPRGSALASLTRSGSPCWATQPVNPSPRRQRRRLHVDLLVCADPALERDRHDVVGRLDEVDPGVVVVDDLARLLDDRPADLPRRELARLSRAEPPGGRSAGRPAAVGLRDEVGVRDAIAACVARVETKATSTLVQARGCASTPDNEPMTWSSWISGATMSPAMSKTPP